MANEKETNFLITPSPTPSPNIEVRHNEKIQVDKLVVDLTNSAINTLNIFLVFSLAFLLSFLNKRVIQPYAEKVNLMYAYSLAEESKIESILAQIMGITRCDRVILFEFHNGDKTKGGRHLNKLSATQEITGPGITRISSHFQSLLVSRLHPVLSKLQTESYIKTDVEALSDPQCRSNFISHGVEYCISRMHIQDGVPLSVMQLQYCRNQREDFDAFNIKHIDKLLIELDSLVRQDKDSWFYWIFKMFSSTR